MISRDRYVFVELLLSVLVTLTSASLPVVTIYAVAGMPTVQLPCSAIHHVNPILTHEIELMWAMKEKAETKDWRMVIVKDKDGPTETFRQLILGGNTFANTSHKNEQFYGCVNVTQPYGNLVISQVKIEDSGQFLCHYKVYKNMRSKEHGKSIVELIVEALATTGTNNTFPGNSAAEQDKKVTSKPDPQDCKQERQMGWNTIWVGIPIGIFIGIIFSLFVWIVHIYYTQRRNV